MLCHTDGDGVVVAALEIVQRGAGHVPRPDQQHLAHPAVLLNLTTHFYFILFIII